MTPKMCVVGFILACLSVASAADRAEPMFPVWLDTLGRFGRDELAVLAQIEEVTRSVAQADLEPFSDLVFEEGGAIERVESITGRVQRTIEITPLARLGPGSLPYSVGVKLLGGTGTKPGAVQPALKHIANESFQKWKDVSGFEAGGFLATTTNLASAEAAASGFRDLLEVNITFEPTGGFHTEFSAFCFRVEFLVADTRTLPAKKRTLSYFALTGLRDSTTADGSTLKRNGHILRAEPLEWVEPVARTKDGIPIWSD